MVITNVAGPVKYAINMCFGTYIAFAEKLLIEIWNDCTGKTSITPRAVDVTELLHFIVLGSTVFIAVVIVVTMIRLLYGS